MSPPVAVAIVVPLVVVVLLIAATLAARRRGYDIGGETIVRCRQGHLFTTVWLPGGSLKAVRLGPLRYQWCPVGRHWALVAPVRDSDLTDAERRFAVAHRDTRIP